MTVIATKGKVLSDVLMQDAFALVENFNYTHDLRVDEAATKAYNVGQVVMWDASLSGYRQIVAGDFTGDAVNVPAAAGTAPDGAKFAVVVGFDSLGDTVQQPVSVTTAGRNVVGLFRGLVSVKKSGLLWDAGLNAAKIASVSVQLQAQGIDVKNTLGAVSSSFYGA